MPPARSAAAAADVTARVTTGLPAAKLQHRAVHAAADPLRDEPVWRVLLQHLDGSPPDVQLVCSLLQCSSYVQQLVHEYWAGRLVLRLPGSLRGASTDDDDDDDDSDDDHGPPVLMPGRSSRDALAQQQQGRALCCWLAKHAVLLSELHLQACSELEGCVSAGLRAAAGAEAAAAAAPSGRAAATLADAASSDEAGEDELGQLAASARASLVAAWARSRQLFGVPCSSAAAGAAAAPLPLRAFRSRGFARSGVLSCLPACAAQLTRLDLTVGIAEELVLPPTSTALGALPALCELRLATAFARRTPRSLRLPDGLRHASRLVSLHINTPERVSTRTLARLPRGLTALKLWCSCRKDVDLSRFTALQRLRKAVVGGARDASLLPPSIRDLSAGSCRRPGNLTHLTQLERLEVTGCELEDDLAGYLSLTQLKELRLDVDLDEHMSRSKACAADGFLAAFAAAAPRLPALHLGLSDGRLSAAGVGQLGKLASHLTSLEFDDVNLECTAAQLAAQLKCLTSLQRLRLECTTMQPPKQRRTRGGRSSAASTAAAGMQPLVAALTALCAVTQMTLFDLPLDEQQLDTLYAAHRGHLQTEEDITTGSGGAILTGYFVYDP